MPHYILSSMRAGLTYTIHVDEDDATIAFLTVQRPNNGAMLLDGREFAEQPQLDVLIMEAHSNDK